MSAFPNNDQNGGNNKDPNKNNHNFGKVFVNQARRNELQKGVAADEEEYNRYRNQRPEGGSGVLGGQMIENQNMRYKPDDMVIFQTMQTMDIDYDEAYTLLVMQNEERTNKTTGVEQRRRLLSKKARERERKKIEQREERNRKAKKMEEDEIQRKKDRARLKGLENAQRKRQQKQMEKQISRIHGDKRREARLKTLDKSGSNKKLKKSNISLQVSRDSKKNDTSYGDRSDNNNFDNNYKDSHSKKNSVAKQSSSGEYWERRAMELLDENQKLKHQNDILRNDMAVLKLQSGHDANNANSPNSPSHQIFIGSEEWRQLIQCDEITREATLQYLCNVAKEAEDGNADFPSISYAIACVKDMMNENIDNIGTERNNIQNLSLLGMNDVNNPETESFINVDKNENEDGEDLEMEQKPTPEELRALRLSRYT
jgi:hypothetical protein